MTPTVEVRAVSIFTDFADKIRFKFANQLIIFEKLYEIRKQQRCRQFHGIARTLIGCSIGVTIVFGLSYF